MPSLCLDANIDAITEDPNHKLLIFSGKFFYKFDPYSEITPQEKDAHLLVPELQNIDSAFMDPKTSSVYVIKDDKLIPFPSGLSQQIESISKVFPTFKGKVDAIRYDHKSNQIHLFSV